MSESDCSWLSECSSPFIMSSQSQTSQDPAESTPPRPRSPVYLNNVGCRIGHSDGKGRGVFATKSILSRTLIEVSPVLLFPRTEYEEHGKHTLLDHYTFKWPDGRMALALGLGSLFNHSESPNVSFTIDTETNSIRYTTSRDVRPDEELCIFYGHTLWFQTADPRPSPNTLSEPEDGWGGLSNLDDETNPEVIDDDLFKERLWALLEGDQSQVIPEEQLPFKRMKLTPDDEEEEEMTAIRTEQAWVVDIPDQTQITMMLKWLRQASLESPSMVHLKRIRRGHTFSTLLLAFTSTHPTSPPLPETIELPDPYILTVPRTAALTPTSLKLKSSLWPTVFAPRRKGEPEECSRGKLRWAWEAMKFLIQEAKLASSNNELPIVAYVPVPYEPEVKLSTQFDIPFSACDTRKSTSNPLRHAVLNVVRKVADYRATYHRKRPAATASTSTTSLASPTSLSPSPSPPPQLTPIITEDNVNPLGTRTTPQNGSHYLLTGLTLFISHEPCLMCSMALLHSRVKEIFYLVPMEKTGGCGGVACVPKLEGVNHRYGISRWNVGEGWINMDGLEVDDFIDA